MDHDDRGARPGRRRHARPSRTGPAPRSSCRLEPGERLRVVKFLAYGWSSRAVPAGAARPGRRRAGRRRGSPAGTGLLGEQRAYLDEFWDAADVEVDGDPEVQQAVRFGLFHVLQAGARAERRPIPAKGLTGPGYDGHTFWDTEMFVLPVLDLHPAGGGRRTRCAGGTSTLDLARDRARTLGLAGAAFPWRTIRGEECSGYWPAGTAAFHINADIAAAVERHVARSPATRSLQRRVRAGAAGRDGPAVALAGPPRPARPVPHRRRHRAGRVHRARRRQRLHEPDGGRGTSPRPRTRWPGYPEIAERLGVGRSEAAAWRDAAAAVHVPYDERAAACTAQSARFTEPPEWDFDRTPPDSTRCCCTCRTSTCTASRWSSRPTWCWRCTGAATRSPPSRRPATSTTTSAARSGTRRCRPAPRPCWRPRSATWSWPTTTCTRPP